MAKEFPHATVVGVDLSPCPIEPEGLPPNCRFEVDDINFGLTHFRDKFDVIHLRFVAGGLKDFPQRMKDIHSCLKPGGIVLWIEVEYDLYFGESFSYIAPGTDSYPEGSWMQRPMAGEHILVPRCPVCLSILELRRAFTLGGSDIQGMEATLDAGLWDHPSIDPET